MNLDAFYSYHSEAFYTAHIIPGKLINDYSLTLVIGGIFFTSIFILILLYKINFFSGKIFKNEYLIILALIFWIPLYSENTHNNVLDARANYDLVESGASIEDKRVLRYCNLEKAHSINDRWCNLPYYVNFIKIKIPVGSRVFLIPPSDNYTPHLRYHLFPEIKIVDNLSKSDYVAVYHNQNYASMDGKLKSLESNLVNESLDLIHSFKRGAEIYKNNARNKK